eukprot:TRINITY_DN454_c0_g2_i1.p2 TRINITY_DN454_c0_g2~~TRINITY_DN454_c0_g2_i1.p2  ORF type:complete len:244 (-),score=52.34 TRINITY_DN454_c0_g2_i1:126-857(-)
MKVFEGITAEEISETFRDSTDRFLRISKEDAHMMCLEPKMEQHFYKNLIPTHKYNAAAEEIISKVLKRSSSQAPQLVGVHLRNFEGDCLDRAQSVLAAPFARQGAKMCNTVASLVREIMAVHSISEARAVLYISSDGQRPDLIDTFKSMSRELVAFAEEFDTGNLFRPAIDMIIFSRTTLFVGNGMSTFSTHVSNWRSSGLAGRMGWNVLSWPRLEKDSSVEAYWDCFHSNYWCTPFGIKPFC